MSNAATIAARRAYTRPQGVLFSDSPWEIDLTTVNGSSTGTGYFKPPESTYNEFADFLILSDHSRSPLDFKADRVETRERMIDGSMRSYWVADKRTLSTSWSLLPSRAWYIGQNNNITLDKPLTADGGAGGNELLEWYRRHRGSFYVLLSYDRYPINEYARLPDSELINYLDQPFLHLDQYTEQYEMFFSSFDYSVEKRSQNVQRTLRDLNNDEYTTTISFDLWNVSLSLEEV